MNKNDKEKLYLYKKFLEIYDNMNNQARIVRIIETATGMCIQDLRMVCDD